MFRKIRVRWYSAGVCTALVALGYSERFTRAAEAICADVIEDGYVNGLSYDLTALLLVNNMFNDYDKARLSVVTAERARIYERAVA